MSTLKEHDCYVIFDKNNLPVLSVSNSTTASSIIAKNNYSHYVHIIFFRVDNGTYDFSSMIPTDEVLTD